MLKRALTLIVALFLIASVGVLAAPRAAARSVAAEVPVGDSPWGVGVNPVTNMVYVANSLDDTVSVIDGADNTVVETVDVGDWPVYVAVNPVTNMVYVSNIEDGTVSVIDGVDNTVATTINVGDEGEMTAGVDVNPVTNMVYVASDHDTDTRSYSVCVIDGEYNTVLGYVGVGQTPAEVCVNSLTNRVYVGHDLPVPGGHLSVINGDNNTVERLSPPSSVNSPPDAAVTLT